MKPYPRNEEVMRHEALKSWEFQEVLDGTMTVLIHKCHSPSVVLLMGYSSEDFKCWECGIHAPKEMVFAARLIGAIDVIPPKIRIP